MSPLAQRIRRIAVLVAVLALAAAALGMWPDSVEVHYRPHAAPIEAMNAGGWSLVVWAVIQCVLAKHMYGEPTRLNGVVWIVASIMADVGGTVGWVVEHFRIGRHELHWAAQLTGACIGATAVLVFVVLPIVLVVSKRTEPPDAPSARVVD